MENYHDGYKGILGESTMRFHANVISVIKEELQFYFDVVVAAFFISASILMLMFIVIQFYGVTSQTHHANATYIVHNFWQHYYDFLFEFMLLSAGIFMVWEFILSIAVFLCTKHQKQCRSRLRHRLENSHCECACQQKTEKEQKK